jgi:hypothetical protein
MRWITAVRAALVEFTWMVWAVVLVSSPAAAQTFELTSSMPGGGASIAIVDVNRDGLPDLLGTSAQHQALLLFIAEAPGRFRAPKHHGLGAPIPLEDQALAVGDFTQDGIPEVALALGTSGVLVMIDDGTNTYVPMTPVLLPPGEALSVAIADVTGDGTPDLVVSMATDTGGRLAVFTGNSQRTFTQPLLIPFSGSSGCGTDVIAGDFTTDGLADLLVVCRSGGPYLVRGSGGGAFGSPETVPELSGANSIAAADFNEDGVPDFAYSIFGNAFVVLRGPGGSGGQRFEIPLASMPHPDAIAAATGDFNGDGHADVAIGGFVGLAYIALGNGRGGFGPTTGHFGNGSNVIEIVAGDLNRDGFDDVVLGSTDAGNIHTFLYTPSLDERARMAAGSLTRIEATLADVSGAMQSVATAIGSLQLPNLGNLAALDANVSSRASQESVNGIYQYLGGLDVPVSSRASAAAVSALDARLATLIEDVAERLEGVVLRVSIEEALARGQRLSSFYLPEEHGGALGRVREIVVQAIERNQAAAPAATGRKARTQAEALEAALAFLGAGDLAAAEQRYAEAFDAYAKAYQRCVK